MTLDSSARISAESEQRFDVAIVGGGLAGVLALAYARRAGLDAVVLERESRVGGLWRDLPAWQDIQISTADWALGDVPLQGAKQPHILANIEAWVDRFGLTDDIRLNTPVQKARQDESGWELSTPQGTVLARHLIAATGSHNTPLIPPIARTASSVREFHSSALRDPGLLTGRDVMVVGAGASALDLLELCFEHAAKRVIWVYRRTHWFMPTRKPKHVSGSVRGFAKLQATGMTTDQLSAAIGADLRSRYAKFGLADIAPADDFDVLRDQLIPGRAGMLDNYPAIERYQASVESMSGSTVRLSNGQCIDADILLWGTGYGVDLSYFESPEISSIRTLDALAARCGCIFRSRAAANLYFPGVILDGIGSATWAYSLMFRSIMSHIQGTARLDNDLLAQRLNHIDVIEFLAARDPASFPADSWRAHYRDMVLNTPDEQPYSIP